MLASDAVELARSVAQEAATLVAEGAERVGTIRSKTNSRDLLTEWDTRSEDLIRARLLKATPAIPILGEERGRSGAQQSDFLWLVDPIDGTVNFSHGLPMFAVVIALEHRGAAIAAVVHAPRLGWEFYAHQGGGAFVNDAPMRVSEIDDLSRALLASGFPYDRATSPDNNFAEWEHFQRQAGACRRLGCASIDLALVARGWFDGYWERRLQPWDISAGALLVSEAGGRVTSPEGGAFRSASGEAVASNGLIHEQIVEHLQTVRRRSR